MKSIPIQPDPIDDPATLDLGAVPGVKDHFNRTSNLPILVFRILPPCTCEAPSDQGILLDFSAIGALQRRFSP